MTILELNKTLSPAQQDKAAACTTAAELLAFAQEENLSLTPKQAEEALRLIHPPVGELSDDELDAVAGGGNKFVASPEYLSSSEVMRKSNRCVSCGARGRILVENEWVDPNSSFFEKTWQETCTACGYSQKVEANRAQGENSIERYELLSTSQDSRFSNGGL